MSYNPPTRSRTIAAIIAIIAGVILAVAAVITIKGGLFRSLFEGEVPVSSDRVPFQPDGTAASAGTGPSYATITFGSPDQLVGARVASTVADVLHQLVLVVLAILLITIAVALLRRRPFTRLLRVSLVVLGAMLVVSGMIAPQLDALASDLAVQELGYPSIVIDGPGHEVDPDGERALLTAWSWTSILQRIDAGLSAVGVTLVLVGIFIGDGMRLQHETEGLI